MKDEELAEEKIDKMADDFVNAQEFTKVYGIARKAECGAFWRYGFFAGLKAGRPQWHDINDTEPSKEQLGKQLLIRMESVISNTDYDYLVYKYTGESITDVAGVIAWCELPTFDKE